VIALRYDRTKDTLGITAMNIGKAKGRTFDRVVIFGSVPMTQYALGELKLDELKTRSKLYVAVTRARLSAMIVI
jgi:DNA helicase-2/ATP-dependent DNA helicase PcrA